MAYTCGNCDAEIPRGAFGVEEAVENNLIDEVVAHTYDPEESYALSDTTYYCDPSCFVEEHSDE